MQLNRLNLTMLPGSKDVPLAVNRLLTLNCLALQRQAVDFDTAYADDFDTCLLVLVYRGIQNGQDSRFAEIGAALAVSDLAIALATEPWVFFLGCSAWRSDSTSYRLGRKPRHQWGFAFVVFAALSAVIPAIALQAMNQRASR